MACGVSFSRFFVFVFVFDFFLDPQSVFLHIKIFSRCNFFFGSLIIAN